MKFTLAAVTTLVALSAGFAQPTTKPAAPDAKKEMEGYEASAKPGEMHKKLDAFVGDWDVSMIIQMPGGKDMVLKGTCKKSWTLNGHFVKEELRTPNMTGKMGDAVGYLGYDISEKKFQGVYMSDDMTGMINYSGKASEDGKTFTMTGKESNPSGMGPALDFRITISVESADQHTMTLVYIMPGGNEVPGFKLVHTRKK